MTEGPATEANYQQPNIDLLGAEHVRRYQETGGEVGYIWNGVPSLLLTHTGRTSGKAYTTPLIFARDGDDYLVVASMGGAPMHPQWYLNLSAAPRASIQVKADSIDVVARTVSEEDKDRAWAIVTSVWPNYDVYQSRTQRSIPVVALTPVGSGEAG
ncbi:MAG TPA: nitroreductase family deazaflavin-dependent oxidoreductase [Mycobacteriales bacterium]|nr:nitroreductase family deazaflavin-dependent oxidoreductase [Mycobacteriales bacterium]